jgi:hypothetical protein
MPKEPPSNCSCWAKKSFKIRGMIDANAYHANLATWPTPLVYVRIENTADGTVHIHFIDSDTAKNDLMFVDKKNITDITTTEIGGHLIKLNSCMYNEYYSIDFIEKHNELTEVMAEIEKLLNGRERKKLKKKEERRQLNDLEKKEKNILIALENAYCEDVPSLIMATTMDMEFAHLDGHNGVFIPLHNKETGTKNDSEDEDNALLFIDWEEQILNMEETAESYSLRLFLLFSYDPRRYRLPYTGKFNHNIEKHCKTWDEPFARIIGCEVPTNDFSKIWLGFCLNPTLGFRPFDEFYEHLTDFYKTCDKEKIPILAHCAVGGITVYDTKSYKDFDIANEDERKKKNNNRNGLNAPSSSMYRGNECVADDTDLNHFYMNYGHPRNWIPVLKYFPGLRLCLAGFGGNSEWQHPSMIDWVSKTEKGLLSNDKDDQLPPREWIRCIIKLTRDNNVYTDISGLNIYNHFVWFALRKMLQLIQDEHENFKHLKFKLIFGSGWYFTYLMDMSNCTEFSAHSYSDYCREFKKLFDEIDPTGEFGERVSLINPWKFYGLDNGKIDKIYTVLQKNSIENVNSDMLEEMKRQFDDSDDGLVKYISDRMKNDPNVIPKAPNETDNDLAPISNDFGSSLARFTLDNDENYIRGENTDDAVRQLKKIPELGRTKFDCSGWTGYCINKTYKTIYNTELSKDYPDFYTTVVLGSSKTMKAYAEKHGRYREYNKTNPNLKLNPKVGDLAFWEGHVEIVIVVDSEKFSTSGSSGKEKNPKRNNEPDPVPSQKPAWGDSFFENSQDDRLTNYGNGIFLGFWTIDFSVIQH